MRSKKWQSHFFEFSRLGQSDTSLGHHRMRGVGYTLPSTTVQVCKGIFSDEKMQKLTHVVAVHMTG